jgi:hypothetical protein
MGKSSSISLIIMTADLAGAVITCVFCLTALHMCGNVPSQYRLGDATWLQQNRTVSKQMILSFMVFFLSIEH